MAESVKGGAKRVKSPADIGALIREARKRSDLDQETTAALVGVGARFMSEVERGKPSAQLGLVLKVLERLGLEVWIAPRGTKP
jgi:y4mF family transcriptional regulator